MFGGYGKALARSAALFLSKTAIEAGVPETLGLERPAHAVSGCRSVTKADMALNDATPQIDVDPETYEVRADGELLTCAPAESLPMAQRYYLF
jgi:urease subunit alpha